MFEHEGNEYSLGELLECNSENEKFCDWLRTALVGQTWDGVTRME
jgi:hypothetical protein